jgi:homoserine O-acetyltransferase/O-succinyltransferase
MNQQSLRHRVAAWLPHAVVALAAAVAPAAMAYDGAVEKKVFSLPTYTTEAGKTIKQVKVGYETYGKLNAAGDNAIFVSHFYPGTSHAAGKYKPSDAAAGYWDHIIGAGKTIDTDKYFVVSADMLSNIFPKALGVVTTGPATLDPDTGKPYGMSFPVVSTGDSVRVHKALLDALGVKKLKAVIGASTGAIQAIEWAVNYPDLVERVVHVVGPGFSVSPWAIALLDTWVLPIKADPRWQGGDYYDKEPPSDGVVGGINMQLLFIRHWDWFDRSFGYKTVDAGKRPQDGIGHEFAAQDAMKKTAAMLARPIDANHMIYMTKALQLYNVESQISRIKAKVLFVPVRSDIFFPPEFSQKAAVQLKAQGGSAEVFVIDADGGHRDGIAAIDKASDAIKAFLTK